MEVIKKEEGVKEEASAVLEGVESEEEVKEGERPINS